MAVKKKYELIGPCSKYIEGKGWTTEVTEEELNKLGFYSDKFWGKRLFEIPLEINKDTTLYESRFSEGYDNSVLIFNITYMIYYKNTNIGQFQIVKDNKKQDIFLWCFGISKEYRCKGIGTSVLKHLTKHIPGLSLHVERDNERAIKLYKKCGFKRIDGRSFKRYVQTYKFGGK